VNRLLAVSTTFNAIHSHVERQVGHRFVVTATVAVGSGYDIDEVRGHLAAIRAELHARVIETMLPGVDSSVIGLAAWAFERLSGPLPKLESVSVSEDDALGPTGTVSRTIR